MNHDINMSKLSNFLILISCCVHLSFSSRILFILPSPSYSQHIVGSVLSKVLALKGHDVTVIGPLPPDTEIKNYTYIKLEGVRQALKDLLGTINVHEYDSLSLITKTMFPQQMGYTFANVTFNNKEVQKLLKSKEEFDAVVLQLFSTEALYGICHHFEAPCIALTTAGSNEWANRLTGNVGMSSYVPDMITDLSPEMSFCERTYNLLAAVLAELTFHFYALPKSTDLVRSFLPQTPHLYDLIYNTSLVLLNSHPALTTPLPLTPNMKEIGGIHIEGLRDVRLPEDVQKFLDEHEEGVIYFALGSNIRSKDLPKEKLEAILATLKRWGKPILWKFEGELPEKMEHVMVAKWFPQTAVLAHKNIKAFVTHGGRLSTMESLYYGVPMVAISIAAEQSHNAAEMAYLGYAIWLKFKTLTAESFYDALVDITSNPKYSKEAKYRSKAMRKSKATDEAIYWIEHIIEFRGASYLRNAGVKLPWYKFWMVDVIASIVLMFGASSVFTIYIIRSFIGKAKKGKKIKIN